MEAPSLLRPESVRSEEPRPSSQPPQRLERPLPPRQGLAGGQPLCTSGPFTAARLSSSAPTDVCPEGGKPRLSACRDEAPSAETAAAPVAEFCCCCAAEEAGGVVSVRSARLSSLQRIIQQLAASRGKWSLRAAQALRRLQEASAEKGRAEEATASTSSRDSLRCCAARGHRLSRGGPPFFGVEDFLPPPCFAAVALPAHSALGCLRRQQRSAAGLGGGVCPSPGVSLTEAVLRHGGGTFEVFEALGETRLSVAAAAAGAACSAAASGDEEYIHSANAAASEAWSFLGVGGSETPADADLLPVATHGVGLAKETLALEASRVQQSVALQQQLRAQALALHLRLGRPSQAERILPRFVEGSAEGSAGAGCSLCLASALVALRKGQDSLGVRLLQLALRRAAVSVQATEAALRFRASRKETLSSCGRRAGLSLGGQIGASSLNAAVAAAGRATSVYAAALERQAFREGGLSRQGDKETAAGGVCVERRSDDDGASSRRRLWNSLLALYALGLVSLHLALLLENRPELHPQIYLQSLPNLAEALKAHNRAAAASCLEGLTGASQGGSEDNVKNKDKAKAAASGGEAGGEAKAARGASSLTPASAAAARYHLRLDGSWAFPAFEASALAALSLRGKTSCRQPPSSVAAGGGSVLSSASCADGKREKRPKHRPLSAAAENSCAASAASGELPSLEAAARAVAASEGSATEDEVLADEIEARQQRGSEGLKRRRRAALLKSDCEKFVDCLLEVAEACARRMSVATASTPSEPCEEETSAASRDEASTKSLPLNPASGTAASVRRRQRRLCSSLSTQTLLVRASVCLHRHCKVGLLPSAAARREVESLLLLLLQRLVRCLCHSGGPPLRSLSRRPHEAELATTRLFACSSLRASGGAAGRLASAGDFAEEDAESGGGFDSHSASAALQLLLYGSAAGVSSNVLPHGVLLALSLILAPNLEGGGAFWRARAAAKAASCRGRSIEPLFSAFGREDKGQGPSAVAAAATSLASTESRVSPRPRRPPPLLGKKGRAFCGRLVLLHRGHAEAEMALGALAAAAFAGRDLWTAPPRLSSFPLPAAGDVAALCAREEIKVSNALGEQLPPLALFGLLSRTNSECRFSAEGDLVWSERSARDCEAEAFPRFEGSACGGCSLPVEDGAFQALLLRLDLHLETLATNAGWEGGSLEKEGHLSSEAVKTLFALSVAKAEVETEAQRMPLLLREAVCECLLRRSERLLFCLGEIQERLQICFYGEQQEVPAALAAECLYLRAMACASASSSLLSTSSSESEETEALSNPRLEFPLSDPRPLRRSSRPLFNSETKRRGPCCCWVEDASVEEPLRKKPHIEGKGEKNSLPEKVRFASQAPALPVGESLSRSLLRPLQGLDSPEEGFCCNQKRAEEAGRLLHEASCFASAALALWKNNAPAVGLWGGHLQKRRRRELRLLVLAETASCIQRLSEQSSDTAAGEEGGRSEASLSEMDSLRRKFASQRRALEEEDGGVASCDGAASEAGASAGLEAFSSRRCACSERRAACCCWGGFRGGSFGCCCVETSASPEVFEDKPFLPCRRRLAGMGRSAATQEASWPLASQPDTTGEERRPGKRQREKAEASSVSLRSAPWICGSDSQQLAAALVATLRSRGEKPF